MRAWALANVNRRQLDEALELAPIAAVQVALSPFDDRALRGGVVERCAERGHRGDRALAARRAAPRRPPRPPPGARRGRRGARRDSGRGRARLAARPVARRSSRSRARGGRRPRAPPPARRARLELTDDRAALDARVRRRARPAAARPRRRRRTSSSSWASPAPARAASRRSYVARGYVRLNRDERGGSLRELADALDEALVVGRPADRPRQHLPHARGAEPRDRGGGRHGVARAVRLARHAARPGAGQPRRAAARALRLAPDPEELRELARREPGVLAPTSQMRALRELEPPSADEGFAARRAACRSCARRAATGRAGVFVAAAALRAPGWEDALERARSAARRTWSSTGARTASATRSPPPSPASRPRSPGRSRARCARTPAGPPICWCRPPLPGLPLAFARAHGVDPARSILIGTGPAHRTLAAALGARYVQV